MDIRELKEEILNREVISDILSEIGCHHIQDRGEYFSCGNPDGDNPRAIVVYKNEYISCTNYTRQIIKNGRAADIFDLISYIQDCSFAEAMKFGARGYILKNSTSNKILDTIKNIYMEDLMCKSIAWLGKEVFGEETLGNEKGISSFTRKEKEIVKEIASGLTNKEIAKKLFISEGAVKKYINSILSKTGLVNRVQIAMYYLKDTTG